MICMPLVLQCLCFKLLKGLFLEAIKVFSDIIALSKGTFMHNRKILEVALAANECVEEYIEEKNKVFDYLN